MTDPYAVLGVTPRAEPEVIEAAYRALARKYHPDQHGDIFVMQRLNEAHDILIDSVKRRQFDTDTSTTTGSTVGNYRIIELISEEGGFGITYKAEHLLTGKFVCIKQCSEISPVREEILIDEAKSIWDLRHFALPTMRDLIRFDDGSLGIVMSYIPGPTIQQIVEKTGPLEAEHVAWIADRVLNALSYLHRHGVIHGDIKPQNIIVQPESHMAVLIDFGLSQSKPTADTHSIAYTPVYSPPEELDGMPLLPESDFYSLGMTMLYALTGDLHRVTAKQIPNNVPKPFTDFIGSLVRHDIHNRPNWEKMDLCAEIETVRKQSFGRVHSGMKPISGLA